MMQHQIDPIFQHRPAAGLIWFRRAFRRSLMRYTDRTTTSRHAACVRTYAAGVIYDMMPCHVVVVSITPANI